MNSSHSAQLAKISGKRFPVTIYFPIVTDIVEKGNWVLAGLCFCIAFSGQECYNCEKDERHKEVF